MDQRLERKTNEQLRDVPCDPEGLKQYVSELSENLKNSTDVKEKVKILGEMGVHLRSLNELDLAKNKLNEALKLIEKNQLGIKLEIQQKIRIGHVLQWQGLFNETNILFENIISVCRTDKEAEVYLDFALQHSGKNLFEQQKFSEALKLFDEAMALRTKRNAPIDQIESTKLAIQKTRLNKLLSQPLSDYIQKANCFNAVQLYWNDSAEQKFTGPEEFVAYIEKNFSQIPQAREAQAGDVVIVWSRSSNILVHGQISLEQMSNKAKGYPFGLIIEHAYCCIEGSHVFQKRDPHVTSRYEIISEAEALAAYTQKQGYELTRHRRH